MRHPAIAETETRYHREVDPHRGGSMIAQLVLGGQDGLVNVLGVVLGVAAAGATTRIVLVGGVAAAIAESVSMAAVAYTSSIAEGEHYESERIRELRHVQVVPELERDEVRALYRAKGFGGELLERVVATITADPEVWVAVMMAEEHHLAPTSRSDAFRSALVVGLAALIGSAVPLAPFLLFAERAAMWATLSFSAVALFAFGVFKARRTVGRPARSGLELAAIGVASALAAWLVGLLLGAGPG